jgi:hypothetical protein
MSKLLISIFKLFNIFLISGGLYFNGNDLLLVFLFTAVIWGCLANTNFRYKVKYFLSFLVIISLFGFSASYDGCILLLLLTEFFILLIFFLVYLTTDQLHEFFIITPISFKVFIFSTFLIYFLTVGFSLSGYSYQHYNFYEASLDITTSDFFAFYQLFFIYSPLLVAYCGLILSFFIIFFVFFYFQLKKTKIQGVKRASSIDILRKQNPVKQAKHKAQIRTFKVSVPKRQFFNTQRF